MTYKVNQVFGGTSGLGLVPLTFDWTIITGFTGNPMIPPWHAIANTLIGVVVFYIFGSLTLHYSGAWFSEFLPMRYVVGDIATPQLLTASQRLYNL